MMNIFRKETSRRLPPGQVLTMKWPVLSVGSPPKFNPENWSLEVYGEVENRFKLSWQQFLSLPIITSVSDFHCVTAWSRFDNKWEGVSFRTINEMAKPKPTAKFVVLECDNDYTTSLPLEVLLDDNVLFAYKHDDKPLEPEHGGPMRLVVPKKYAWKSAKWVRKVKYLDREELGFWEVRGYSNTADPGTEDRYAL